MDTITDQQWDIIAPQLPDRVAPPSRAVDDRVVRAAMAWAIVDGVSWDTAASGHGLSSSTLRMRWKEWCAADVWARLFRGSAAHTDVAHEWAKAFAVAALTRVMRNAARRRTTGDSSLDTETRVTRPTPDDYRSAWQAQCDHDATP